MKMFAQIPKAVQRELPALVPTPCQIRMTDRLPYSDQMLRRERQSLQVQGQR